ncbi:RidA family protein [Psychromicrobium xiongbiense]|uniref:RidA family protein n=1 Tax=Psychromicrobium xiongbiense TaxID=3051184 RepID=UPI002555489D|nr:Rid family hydrolase [Psychromicrobium sp. YIM S02556]
MERIVIRTPYAPQSNGGSSQGLVYQGLLYISGQLPLDPATGLMAGNRPPNPVLWGRADQVAADQMHQCLKNLSAICHAAGADLSNAIKVTLYIDGVLTYFPAMDQVYSAYFREAPPARSVVGSSTLPGNALVLADAIVPLG